VGRSNSIGAEYQKQIFNLKRSSELSNLMLCMKQSQQKNQSEHYKWMFAYCRLSLSNCKCR